MPINKVDAICALATPPGRGGIGVVRLSGHDLTAIAAGLIGNLPKARYAKFTRFMDASSEPIDEGIALYFPAPHSFTGEHVLELQGHGGPAVMQALLDRCLELGARLAMPGEFSLRAFLNGKLDLAQAESVADLIDASSIEAARSALHSLTGEFSRRIQAMQQRLTELRMRVEASLDFPEEEDIVEVEREKVRRGTMATLEELAGVLAAAKQGALLREGVHVALIGQPNVGKSSLMNALAGQEVAIVTDIAGTTRDAVRQEVLLSGVSFHLIDTAGLRETSDTVEKMGIARTWAAVEQAGIALLLVDSQHGLGEAEQKIIERLPAGITRMTVHNKIDLSGEAPRCESGTEVWLSAKTGEGIDLLRTELLRIAGWQPAGEGGFMARRRHLDALGRAQWHLKRVLELSGQQELQAEELRLAQEALSEITGEFTPDDLLGEIFSRFCIGK
ncbi:MAG: tRNA uridine-5-carboxymethylaminomethyl(34) synthesis GTPase MnmE [Hydrogenophilaceae bacterium]|nr:tRNA uridine-5-carboxymethylaminomethyl(34) synthesis GTPase MnmE [Hydrogenophilaceae bacterium]